LIGRAAQESLARSAHRRIAIEAGALRGFACSCVLHSRSEYRRIDEDAGGGRVRTGYAPVCSQGYDEQSSAVLREPVIRDTVWRGLMP
jgi:hypothetical protein